MDKEPYWLYKKKKQDREEEERRREKMIANNTAFQKAVDLISNHPLYADRSEEEIIKTIRKLQRIFYEFITTSSGVSQEFDNEFLFKPEKSEKNE